MNIGQKNTIYTRRVRSLLLKLEKAKYNVLTFTCQNYSPEALQLYFWFCSSNTSKHNSEKLFKENSTCIFMFINNLYMIFICVVIFLFICWSCLNFMTRLSCEQFRKKILRKTQLCKNSTISLHDQLSIKSWFI